MLAPNPDQIAPASAHSRSLFRRCPACKKVRDKMSGMNYELARELKEAGFPQDLGGQREERCYINERGHMYTYENSSFDVEL